MYTNIDIDDCSLPCYYLELSQMFSCYSSNGNCHAEQPYAIWRHHLSSDPWGGYGHVTRSNHLKSVSRHIQTDTHPPSPPKISSFLQEIHWRQISYLAAQQRSYDQRQQLEWLQDHRQRKWIELEDWESMQEACLHGYDHPNRRK